MSKSEQKQLIEVTRSLGRVKRRRQLAHMIKRREISRTDLIERSNLLMAMVPAGVNARDYRLALRAMNEQHRRLAFNKSKTATRPTK